MNPHHRHPRSSLAARFTGMVAIVALALPLAATQAVSAGIAAAGTGKGVSAGTSKAAAARWARATLTEPASTFDGQLNGAACSSTINCWAVGWGSTSGSLIGTLVEHWNGTAWAPETSPNPTAPGDDFPQMNAVTCLSKTECTAVGTDLTFSNTFNSMVESWNGTKWSVIPSPNVSGAADNVLSGVTCESATLCMAVGNVETSYPDVDTLIEQWDGTSWSIDSSPDVSGDLQNKLTSVSCPSAADCIAVGYSQDPGNEEAVVETWNGTTWTMGSPAVPSESASDDLSGITCTSISSCVAVGRNWATENSQSATLAEQWSGAEWSVVSTPNPTGILGDFLLSVSCSSATTCEAAGESFLDTNGDTETLVEQLSGGTWSLESSPNAARVTTSSLAAVACAKSTTPSCVAVGASYSSEEDHLLAIGLSSGAWTLKSIPGPTAPAASYLQAAGCSTSTCVAVGYTYPVNPGESNGLVYKWNGKKWSLGKSAEPAGADVTGLYGASCPSSTECIAVGDVAVGTDAENGLASAFAEEMTGSTWSAMTTPDPVGAQYVRLTGVSCSSATTCTAVGFSKTTPESAATAFAERLSGSRWTLQVTAAPTGATSTSLEGVACPSASVCNAVGSYVDAGGATETLIERWNGKKWRVSTSPNVTGAAADHLLGVSCPSTSTCVATGYSEASDTAESSLAVTLRSSTWTLATTPDIASAFYNVLTGVTCPTTSDCIASGYSANDYGDTTRLAQWNGKSWSFVYSGRIVGDYATGLNGVACTSASFCVSAGSGPDGFGQDDALVEQN